MVTTRQLLLKANKVHMLEIKLLEFINDLGVPSHRADTSKGYA